MTVVVGGVVVVLPLSKFFSIRPRRALIGSEGSTRTRLPSCVAPHDFTTSESISTLNGLPACD